MMTETAEKKEPYVSDNPKRDFDRFESVLKTALTVSKKDSDEALEAEKRERQEKK